MANVILPHDSESIQVNSLTKRQMARLDALMRRYPDITQDSIGMMTYYDTSTVMMSRNLPHNARQVFRLWAFKTWATANRKLYAAMDYIARAQAAAPEGGQS